MRVRIASASLDIGRKSIMIISRQDARALGLHPLEMVVAGKDGKEVAAMVEIGLVGKGEIIVTRELAKILGAKAGDEIQIRRRGDLKSKKFIRRKMEGKPLGFREYLEIVKDVVSRKLNDLEMAAFLVSLQIHGLPADEAANLSMAMVRTGKTLKLRKKVIADKHSIGGVPGDKTTLLVVPIIASLGITIPKTSSRAITSPAGTADREEVILRNDLSLEEMKEVVEKANGCLAWGGSLDMSPADDLFITIERPLGIDPLFVPSIMSKKKAVGATHLVLDIPTGKEAKVPDIKRASEIFRKFRAVAERMKIRIRAVSTFASQPLGRFVGPAPEAYEALSTLLDPEFSPELAEKAISVSGLLISMVKKVEYRKGKELAKKALYSGKAYEKLVEIADLQGRRAVKPEEVEFGKFSEDIYSDRAGFISSISNRNVVEICRMLGNPFEKRAGIEFHKKIGDKVERDERIMTIYAESRSRLNEAVEAATGVFSVSKKRQEGFKAVLKVFG